jgi:hypothetical protein
VQGDWHGFLSPEASMSRHFNSSIDRQKGGAMLDPRDIQRDVQSVEERGVRWSGLEEATVVVTAEGTVAAMVAVTAEGTVAVMAEVMAEVTRLPFAPASGRHC